MATVKDKAHLPQTVAVIDIGSNSVRMVVAQVLADGGIEALERMQRPVRLGQDTFVRGRLSQSAMKAATDVLRDYRRILDTYQVEHVRAVATSAVREAGNSDAFLDRVFMATALDVEVIEPTEESRLTVGAVLEEAGKTLGVSRGDTLIADVGGGSALLTLLRRGEIFASGSYGLGSIRLQERLGTSAEPPERAADMLRHQIATVVGAIRASLPLKNVRCFVAMGGDARFAARQMGKGTPSEKLHLLGVEEFDAFVAGCAGHPPEELGRMYGLPFADAETAVPALLAYQCLLHETRARQMSVTDVSMRDGLLLDVAREVRGQDSDVLEQSVVQSAKAIGEKYRYDAAHAGHVSELAVRIFDDLQREHGLGPRQRLLLRVAAILHDIGGYVGGRAHHKHSYYLVSNSEVFGLRRGELEIVAHVARYHRRSCPKPTHLEYVGLPREMRVVVSKLAAMLRVADALDHGHTQHVRDIQLERLADELVIHVRRAADLTLERRSLATKADLFEDVYGMRVRLEEADR